MQGSTGENRQRRRSCFPEKVSRAELGLSIRLWSQETDMQKAGSPDGSHSLLLQCLPCQPS